MSGVHEKDVNAGYPGESDRPNAVAVLRSEDHADMTNALKDKLQNLTILHKNNLDTLGPKVRKRVEVLRDIQGQHDELEVKFLQEKAALVAKYQELYEPLYSKRFAVVNGITEFDEEKSEVVNDDQVGEEPADVQGVPEFWLIAMKNNEILANEITERDEGALRYLKDIKWYQTEDPKGFKLEFYFDANPFFKNSVLTKTYHMEENDEPVLEKVIGVDIEWHQGKCLTQKLVKRKPRKGAKNAKPVIKTENCDSFFNFFKPPEVPRIEDDIDDDTIEELQNLMDQDYEVASTIRNKIIPHAVSWFTGEAVQDDDYSTDDDNDDEKEDYDGDDDKDGERAQV